MNNEVKVYTPEIVADSAFPTTGEMAFQESSGQSTRIAQDTFGAKETAEKGFPLKLVAKELLSTAINTMTQKIVKTFEFVKQGAIQIGEYINGVSGDIRISPDGITARNKSGITTFSIDGDTGDAIFSGDVRAATFTSDYFNVDSKGNVVAQSIKLSSFVSAQDTTSWGDPGFRNSFTADGDYVVDSINIELDLIRDSLVAFALRFDGVYGNIWDPLNYPPQTEAQAEVYVCDTYNGKKTILSTTLISMKTQVGYPNAPSEYAEEVLLTTGPIDISQTFSNFSVNQLNNGSHKITLEVHYEILNTSSTDPSFNLSLPSLYVFTIGSV